MNWLWVVIGYGVLTIFVLLYFKAATKAAREHDAMIEREEQRIREDARRMRAWYREQTERKDAQTVEAFLAEL